MNGLTPRLQFPELERYELSEPLQYHFELNRREFVQTLGAGLLITMVIPEVFAQRRGRAAEASVQDRLHIGTNGAITVFTSKVEVGQGSRTELTIAAAEELQVPVGRIKLVMADTSVGPNDGGTAGSRTTPDAVPSVRRGCAAARQLLIESAARKFNIDAAKLQLKDGAVEGLGQGQSFGYGDLAADADALKAAQLLGFLLDREQTTEDAEAKGPAKNLTRFYAKPLAACPKFTVRGIENAVLAGSSTVPGVGVPTALLSGRLAADRVTGVAARRRPLKVVPS